MKRICASLFITALALLAVFPATQAKADTEITLNTFYDALEPQGDWIYVEDYGYCFRPFVSYDNADWQPYTEGYWAETDAGWTWVSDEDFGWATYHYGRWAEVGGYWVWVPGYDWAPAWVSWRNNDEYVGWAPLPPEARWEVGVGFHDWVDSYYDIGPSSYNFVPVRHFGAERCSTVIIDRRQNFGIINVTTNITNISFRSGGGHGFTSIYVGGPDYDRVNRYSERKIRRLTLREDDRRDFNRDEFRRGGFRNRIDDNAFTVFAPRVDRDKRDFSPAKIKARFDKDSIDRGWRNIDQNQAREIRQKFDEDAKRGPNGRDRNDENFRRSVTAAPVVAKAPTPDVPRGTDRRRDGDRGPEGRPERRGSDDNTASTDRRDGNRRPGTGVDSEGKPVIPRAEVMPDGDSKTDRPKDPNATAGRGRDGEGRERDGNGKMPTTRPDENTASTGRRDGDRSRDGAPVIPRAEVLPEARTGRDGDGNGKMNPQRPDDLPSSRTDRPGEPSGGNTRRGDQDQNREGRTVPRAEVMPEGRNPSGGSPEIERRRPEMPDRSSTESVRPALPQTRPQEVRPVVPDQKRSNMERPEGRPGGSSGEMNRTPDRRESGPGAGNSNDDTQRMQRQQQQAREATQAQQQSNDANRQRQAAQEAQRNQERQAAAQRERSQSQSQPQRREEPRREMPQQTQPQRREEPRRQAEPQQRPQVQSQPQQRQERPEGGGGGGKREGKKGGDDDDKKDRR